MGLDIYAGTMTRYYAHNWKTAVQQWAEENGYSFQRVTPDGEPVAEEELSPEEIQEIIENWRDQILSAISPSEEKVFLSLGKRITKSHTIPISLTGMRLGQCFWLPLVLHTKIRYRPLSRKIGILWKIS